MWFFDIILKTFWARENSESFEEKDYEDISFDKIEKHRAKLLKFLKKDEKVDILIRLWHELSPTEYEYFVAYIFEVILWYKTFVVWWYNDWWIDIKWAKRKDSWEFEYIAIQCKRWNFFNIKQKHIKEFYWSVADLKYKHWAKLFFATTNYLTRNAKKYTDEHDIVFLDYDVMIKAYEMINRNKFLEFMQNKKQSILANNENIRDKTIQKTKTVKELYFLLKGIRNKLANNEWLPGHCIFSNNTLLQIAEKRPTNKNEVLMIRWIWEIKYKKYFYHFEKVLNNI